MRQAREGGTNWARGERSNGATKEAAETHDEEADNGGLAHSTERRVLTALRRIVHAGDLFSRRLLQEHSVTASQLICLHTLAEEGPLTSRRLPKKCT